MTHETAREALLDLAYGELPAREAREVEAHAAGCDECGAALRRLRETRALVSALPPEPAPEAGERILLAAAREAVRDRRRRRWMPSWLWRGTIAAVTAAAAVALSYRLYALRPARLEREDPDALLGAAPERAPTQAARPDGEAKAEASGGASTSGALAHAPAAGERQTDGAASASRLDERSVVTRRKEPAPSAPPAEERAAAEREVPEP
uniref:anti-sigma factor family protein n=1 Tax=Anaeromyxobacter oryzisoli TaxID=2925408 RepID=UPI001F56C076